MGYGSSKKVKVKIYSEKVIFKLLILNIFALFSIFALNLTLQYGMFKRFEKKVMGTYQSVVASLVNKYPEEELAIVKPILKLEDEELIAQGEKVLNKYGYNSSMKNFIETSFNEEIIAMSLGNILHLIIILISIISFFILGKGYIKNYLSVVSEYLNFFLEKDFNFSKNINKEGNLGRIVNDFNRLGKLLEIEVSRLEDEKESSKEAITDIRHQIKTPLAALSLYNSILEDDDLTKEEKNEFLNENGKAIRKLEELFDSLINVSNLEKDIIRLNPKEKNIKDTLIGAVNSIYLKAEKKNIVINFSNIFDYYIVHDKRWTEEAFVNILDNAIKYNKENGEINISFEKGISFFKIDISDTGFGIEERDYNKIFKRFYRGKRGEINNIDGSGVGLYLSRKILELQGGNITVKSKINKGSKFSLFLQNCK